MPSNDAIDERLRSVELIALKATSSVALADSGLLEAHRSAEETIEFMRARCERAGAHIDALSATVKPGETTIRSELTLSQAAAEQLFGRSTTIYTNLAQAAMSRFWEVRNRIMHASGRDRISERFGQFAEGFPEKLRHFKLPAWMRAVLTLDRDDQSDAALDELFDQIDHLLAANECGKVDEILSAMPVEGPSLTLMMGLLSITRPASDHLPARARFFDRVYRLCKAMRRDADVLLGGLR